MLAIKKGGRPKVENPKIKTISFKISESEYAKILENASKRGLRISAYSRLAVLKKKMPGGIMPTINLKTWTELHRIGVNLNQITKRINQIGDNAGLMDIIKNLQNQVREIRNQIMGI